MYFLHKFGILAMHVPKVDFSKHLCQASKGYSNVLVAALGFPIAIEGSVGCVPQGLANEDLI